MAAFSKIKPGDKLYDVHRHGMGHTTMSEWGCWTVYIKEVDVENRKALASWNGNAPEWWSERRLSKLKRSIPKCVRDQDARRRRYGL